MIEISETETAVLGLLYEHHHYANRIEEIIEKRKMPSWANVEFSQEVLKTLEEKNLIATEKRIIDSQRSKKIYSITDEGKGVFREKIKELMSNRNRIIYPFDLSIANMHFLSKEEIIEYLNTYLKSIDERIKFLDNSIKIQEENNVPFNFIAIFSRSNALLKAERNWLEEFIEKIKNE